MKESDYTTCPFCGKNIEEHILVLENIVDTIDVEYVKNNKYGIQRRWKEVYECPYCKQHFYIICEH